MMRTVGLASSIAVGSLLAACSLVSVEGVTNNAADATGGQGGTTSAGATGGQGGTTSAGATGGQGGTTSAGATGGQGGTTSAGGNMPIEWYAYDYNTKTKTWKAPAPLGEALPEIGQNNPNAPPSSGWLASVYLSDLSRLLVFAEDGMLYQRDATWKAPVSIPQAFKGIDSTKLRSATQVSYAWRKAWDPNTEKALVITLVSNPDYDQYHYFLDGSPTLQIGTGKLSSDTQNGEPDRKNGIESYAFEVFDLSKKGTADGFNAWYQYDDGFIYRLNALFEWKRWQPGVSPFWVNQDPNKTPPLSGVEAAYNDTTNDIIRHIGPPKR